MSNETINEDQSLGNDVAQREDSKSSDEDFQMTLNLQSQRSIGERTFGSARQTQWHFTLLFVILLAFTAYIPLNTLIEFEGLDILLAIVLIAVVYTSSRRHRWILFGLILAVPPLLFASIRELNETTPTFVFATYFFSISVLILLSMVAILQEILHARRVTLHTISGSMSIYLLATLFWGLGYTVIELIWPGSFSVPLIDLEAMGDTLANTFAELFYFSLVTITTAGYGDVTPISPQARSFTSLELIIGQIFLAILVAWLVGMFIAHSMLENEES